MSHVRRDIAIGEAAEKRVMKFLNQFDGVVALKHNDTKTRSHYDLVCTRNGQRFTVEVKHDLYASKSGNVAIEFYNPRSGKDSGINVTRADLWCHIIDDIFYFTTVEKLKQYTHTHTGRMISTGGDGNASLMLYRMDTMLPAIFVTLDDGETLEELLNEI